ncbi:hypothetical protein M434DRAFT_173843 [Hypoxylon sp. CO27-5]|nr:hypothetical protein M434DRAFT_173843 [Hypoxylon sp. CO27-5]
MEEDMGLLGEHTSALRRIPLGDLRVISCVTFVPILRLAFAIIKASRLLFVDDPSRDLVTARTMCNLPDVLQQPSRRFEAVNDMVLLGAELSLTVNLYFLSMSKHIVGIERRYLSKLNPDSAHLEPTLLEAATASSEGALQRFSNFGIGYQTWRMDLYLDLIIDCLTRHQNLTYLELGSCLATKTWC